VSDLTIHVEPAIGLLETPRSITITGAEPGRLVSIRATTPRHGTDWVAQSTFLADSAGTIRVDRDAPAFGDVGRVDAMGLLWAQRPATGDADATPVGVEPLATRLTAWQEDDVRSVAEADLVQVLLADGVTRTQVRDEGLVGILFTPAGSGPFPTTVVLNGSGGGINEARAAAYAARGIQAFALGYFRAPGLPSSIANIPLEYFETGLRWARRTLRIAGGLVVGGQSRGGELSLLLGARFPDLVAGAIGFVPGAQVHGAQGAAGDAGWNAPTWTWRDEPLDHLWDENPGVTWQPWSGGPPPELHRSVYIDGLRDRGFTARSRIPVERIAGPVLCVSGQDDRAWPSSLYSRIVADTVRRTGSGLAWHLDYPDAGHAIGLPNLPSTQLDRLHPVSRVPYSNGGTPWGNAHASRDSFRQVVSFLRAVGDGAIDDWRPESH
jgi:hypothetical protein